MSTPNKNDQRKVVEYNKLVRDKIPKIIKNNGGELKLRRLSDSGFIAALNQKLVEELDEYLSATEPSQQISEAADIYFVICAKLEMYNIFTYQLHRAVRLTNLPSELSKEQLLVLLKQTCQNLAVADQPVDLLKISTIVILAMIAILEINNKTLDDLNKEINENFKKKGGFKKQLLLVWATEK